MADVSAVDSKEGESLDSRLLFMDKLNGPIEADDMVIRKPDGSFINNHYRVTEVIAPGPFDWTKAYNINQEGTHTTGKRGNFEQFLDKGIEPFGFNVGGGDEASAETPAVACGYLKEGQVIQRSETFQRNYGDIFNPESDGFVLVLGPDVKTTEGYEVVGPEVELRVRVTPDMTRAIVVGNDRVQNKVVEELKKRGLVIPVIRLVKTETKG